MSGLSIGVTGGIGCGKTTVCDLFAAHGASLIDTDLIAHQLTAPHGAAIEAITREFGSTFITPDGALDRAAMRQRVFSDPAAKSQLERILHPMIQQQTQLEAGRATGPYRMFIVPLLVESRHWKNRVDRVLVIDCPEEMQIARVMARSGLSREAVLAIMANQVTRAQRLAAADDIIDNSGDVSDLPRQIERLHQQYLTMSLHRSAKAE